MIKNILENIDNNEINLEDISYLWNEKNENNKKLIINHIQENLNDFKITYEGNIYYPTIYKIEDNCPTCGYRTPISRQKYTEEFIVKNIEYKLNGISNYNFSGINCYNKDITGLRELFIILNYLEHLNLNINVALSNYDNLKYLKKYELNSIIYNPLDFSYKDNNDNNDNFNSKYEEQVIRYIKENMSIKVTYVLTLKYNESHHDIFNIIERIKKLNVDYIEIRGFDPFVDSPEEYNPQYSKEFILKIIILLRLYLPNVELKIQYATNENNYLEDYIKLGINTITGIYTKNMGKKLENIDKIQELEKK